MIKIFKKFWGDHMKLHEYQAKGIFKDYGIMVPNGKVISSTDETERALSELKGPPWVLKVQIHAGGRGKAGGVRIVKSEAELKETAKEMFSRPLVTSQTGPEGKKIHQILVEEAVDIEKEFYLGITIDREAERPVLIFSPSGGMEIEEVAAKDPSLIWKEHIDPAVGWLPFQARNIAYRLGPLLGTDLFKKFVSLLNTLCRIFFEKDCSLVEINPLVITKQGSIIALDAKMDIDDNSLFRHRDLKELDDPKEKDPLELKAHEYNLNYIRLDGDIGVMVNGAGLAMATMDLIKMAGAEPANFLDVGGGASEEMIKRGFEIILEDPKVKAILINIFGGILRCDVLARGLIKAAKGVEIEVPLIIRLEGTNVDQGRELLKESGLEFLIARDMKEAARLVAKQVKES